MGKTVLHISTASSFRGGEMQVSYLIKSLENFAVKQILICPEGAPIINYINHNSCKVFFVKKPKSISFSLVKKIKEICKNENIDIVHAHDSIGHTAAVLSAYRNKGTKKVVVTRRVLFPVTGFFSKLKYRTNIVSKIICISKAVEKEMQKIVKKSKTKVISSAIDINKFNLEVIKQFPFLENNFIKIAYVAALTFEKDHITFLNTAKLILQENKKCIFYIIGEGKLKDDIFELVKKMNLENHVVFTGFIKEITQLIPQLDYLLFTSKYEGLGTTILDFFLAKVPVITTLCGGNSEIAIHNETAMVSKTGDYKSLAENFHIMHKDEKLKSKILKNAYKMVISKYSIDELGANTFKEYNAILKEVHETFK